MGSYREAIAVAEHSAEEPDVIATRREGRLKYGFGLNMEQAVTKPLQLFARWGWNEGAYESFAYTEVNETFAAGAQWSGVGRKRPADKIGFAAVSNALSGDHRRYLQLGGCGFLLGDGALNYGWERVWEGYYNWIIGHGMSVSFDLQRIANPGYNRDRGPVLVPGVRLHLEF